MTNKDRYKYASDFLNRQGYEIVGVEGLDRNRPTPAHPFLIFAKGGLGLYAVIAVMDCRRWQSIPLNGLGKSKAARKMAESVRAFAEKFITCDVRYNDDVRYDALWIEYGEDGKAQSYSHLVDVLRF